MLEYAPMLHAHIMPKLCWHDLPRPKCARIDLLYLAIEKLNVQLTAKHGKINGKKLTTS